ncbi:hypothetical protein ACFV0O_28315 [Kitasatospora sp. NPDC059577]|uniref:hypothetical protein n=1 Tax=Kitasatospora sp. NPDC059577 TaxID=3346873 RepID=UPI00368CC193
MSRTVVALDAGGTHVKGAAVAEDGALRHTERWSARAERGPEAVLDTVLDRAAELGHEAGCFGAGLLARDLLGAGAAT